MNSINPLSFDETKLKFQSLAQDIINILFRFNSNIIYPSIKGVVFNIHTQNDILHNPTGTCVNFQCQYKVEGGDKVTHIVDMYLWYNEGRLHREGFPAVIISRNFQNLHEEVWVNGVNPKLKLEYNSEMNKSNCKECKNSFNTSTLKKYDGYCGRCCKKIGETTSSIQEVQLPVESAVPVQYTKKKIPDKLRQEVWEKNIGDKFWGNCFTCNMRLCAFEFSCGHVVSEAEGGATIVQNLKVVCKSCNSKMGTQNMMKFKEHRYSSSSLVKELHVTSLGTTDSNSNVLCGGVKNIRSFRSVNSNDPMRMSTFSGL